MGRGLAIAALSIFVLLLCACGDASQERIADDHGYGFAFDFSSSEGVRFRNAPGLLVIDQTMFDQQVVQAYRETEACTGIISGGPLVVIVDMSATEAAMGMQQFGSAITYLDTGLILASPTAITDPYFYSGNPATRRAPGVSTLRHEYVHFLLRDSLPYDDNVNHRSPLFLACAGE